MCYKNYFEKYVDGRTLLPFTSYPQYVSFQDLMFKKRWDLIQPVGIKIIPIEFSSVFPIKPMQAKISMYSCHL